MSAQKLNLEVLGVARESSFTIFSKPTAKYWVMKDLKLNILMAKSILELSWNNV